MDLTEVDALRAYARMINTLDVSHIELLLDEEVHYASQWMVGGIPSKQDMLDDMESQFPEFRQTGSRPYAEKAIVSAWGHDECRNGTGRKRKSDRDRVHDVKERTIRRIDMCGSPHPSETLRSGEYRS